jgi:rod shape determining protein RodA
LLLVVKQRNLFSSCAKLFDGKSSGRIDWISPLCMLLLSLIGVLFIYSAQAYCNPVPWYKMGWIKQILFILIGAGIYWTVSSINYKIWLKNAHWVFLGSLLLLLAVETPWGVERFHAKRWLNFKLFLFQPSEIAKIGVLIISSSLLTRSKIGSISESIYVLAKLALVFLLPFLLIFRQPDLGSVIIFFPMLFSLLYISKLSLRFFTIVFAIFVLLSGVLSWDIYSYYRTFQKQSLSFQEDKGKYESQSWIPLRDYQRNRILSFIAPEAIDPQGSGVSWNRKQSLISVGSGGLIGKGHGEGMQAKLGYLPQSVAPNDFIFSVIAEEKGVIGSCIVISLLGLLVYNSIRIAGMAKDRFGILLVTGASVIFMVHIFINIGMTIGIMPITGLPLPFLSYGGSFMVSCCILQGLVQSVYRYRRDFS